MFSFVEYLLRTNVLRNQCSGWQGRTQIKHRFAKLSHCNWETDVSSLHAASHTTQRYMYLSCGFRTFQPFSEQPPYRTEGKAKKGHPTFQVSVPNLFWRGGTFDFSTVLWSLADTPRGQVWGGGSRTRSQRCRLLWGRRELVPKPCGVLTFWGFRPSRSLRSESCFSFLARSRRTWSLERHREGGGSCSEGFLEDCAAWERQSGKEARLWGPGRTAGRLEDPWAEGLVALGSRKAL